MGFPVDYTANCLPKGQQKGPGYVDVRHTLVGNSWHVPVIGWLLKELFAPLVLTPLKSLADVIPTAPRRDTQLQSYSVDPNDPHFTWQGLDQEAC